MQRVVGDDYPQVGFSHNMDTDVYTPRGDIGASVKSPLITLCVKIGAAVLWGDCLMDRGHNKKQDAADSLANGWESAVGRSDVKHRSPGRCTPPLPRYGQEQTVIRYTL